MNHTLKASERRGAIAWMAGHSVAANLIMLFFLIGGFISLLNIKQEVFPDLNLDIVQVNVVYPGANPEDVESGIILVIEEAVRGLDGVGEINSVAREGSGSISIEILTGANGQKVAQDIKSEVDRITTFPDDAEEPQVTLLAHKREVLSVLLYGDVSMSILHEVAERARDQLLQDPDITQVEISGLPPLEIGVEISQENLRRYGLTLQEIASRIDRASVDVAGGGLKTPSGEILVRVKERRDFGRQFARLPIVTTADGSQVYLEDIARIEDSFADTDRYSLYNGQPAVELEVYRIGKQTPMQVADAVRRNIPEITADLPPGISASIENDRSDTYRQRVELLLKNGLLGLILVLILLGLFLELRLAFWVMLGIPISFLGSFLFLPSADVTINMMSLFAYIIAIGIVVDSMIVIGENVYYYHQEGMSFLSAAIKGTREVASPVTFSILTNIATFMPLYYIPGTMGKIYKQIPIVVCIAFVISLIDCIYVLPAQLGHQRERKRRGLFAWFHNKQQAFSRTYSGLIRNVYGPFLKFNIKHRYLILAAALSILLVILAYALSGRMGFVLSPKVESDFAQADVVLPFGSPVEKTEAIMKRILDSARKIIDESGHPELVKSITTDIGRGGGHTGRVRVILAEPEIRDTIMSTDEFTNRWRQVVGEVAGVEYMKFASDFGGPGGRGRVVTVELSHRKISVLEQVSRELADVLSTYPTVKDVDDGFQPGKSQLDFAIKPEGKSLGLTAYTIARQVRSAFYGAEALRQQRGRNEIRVMVRLPESERSTEETINNLMIFTPAETYVPLREIATLKRGRSYTEINRRNGRRVIQVSADVTPQSKALEVLADLRTSVLPEFQNRYPGLSYSFEGHQADMRDSMASLRVTFILALLAIYAMLAIPFRSYVQPFIVMVSIPFGIVGAIIGHLIMGYDLSIPSLLGIVALSGVVINNSLVMIDCANRRMRELNLNHHDAIHSAALQRFRPIMLTTLTTFGGLAPMIFETSRQARFLIPMALSLGFGILFSTIITLIIVPSLFCAVYDTERLVAGFKRFLFLPLRGRVVHDTGSKN